MMQNPQVQYASQPPQVVRTQQIVTTQPQTVIIQTAVTPPRNYENYRSKQSLVLGTIQVITGILCVIFQIVAIVLGGQVAFVGHGIWCGIFFILSGSFGIAAGRSRTKCMIVTFMVLSILSAVLTMVLLSMGALGWGIQESQCSYYYNPYRYYTPSPYYNPCRKDAIAMNALLVFLALLEAVVAIWSSAICCSAVCCGPRSVQGQVLQLNAPVNQYGQPGGQQPQIVYLTSPQPGVAYAQQPAQYQQVVTAGGYGVQPQPPPQAPGYQNAGMAMPPPYQPPTPNAPEPAGEQVIKTAT